MAENSSDGSNSSGDKQEEVFCCGICEHLEYNILDIKKHLKLHGDILIKCADLVEGPTCISCDKVNKMLNDLIRRQAIMQDSKMGPYDICKENLSPEQLSLLQEKWKKHDALLCETWLKCKESKVSDVNLFACITCGQVFQRQEACEQHAHEDSCN